jgi:hypothetical protein
MWDFLPQLLLFVPQAVDAMWERTDRNLWAAAKDLDKRGHSGTVAKRFGLVNPDDPKKPKFTGFNMQRRNALLLQAATTPAPAPTPRAPFVPVAGPRDTGVQSGHAYAADKKDSLPKEKTKTRATVKQDDTNDDDDEEVEEVPEQEFLDVLPPEFKIGKKVMKVQASATAYFSCR